jgi:hypothetical protein
MSDRALWKGWPLPKQNKRLPTVYMLAL